MRLDFLLDSFFMKQEFLSGEAFYEAINILIKT